MLKCVTSSSARPLAKLLCVGLALAICVLAFSSSASAHFAHRSVGPKKNYLALGDSLAFGYQPDWDFVDGYVKDFYQNLQKHGTKSSADLGCPGETSETFINGGCPEPLLRKYPYTGSQFNAALAYLASHRGTVSPVTLDIGANDLLPDINATTCQVNQAKFSSDLANLDKQLKQVILPKLRAGLTVHGVITGDIVLMNLYDPYQNICPATVPLVEMVNQHLAQDARGYATIANVFDQFGGAAVPNAKICTYTWICSSFKDIHPRNTGYSAIAQAFEASVGY